MGIERREQKEKEPRKKNRNSIIFDQRGVTLVELLVVLVISGLLLGGRCYLLVEQTRAYTVQEQVVEVQQSLRGAMEIMLRDLRMAGFDRDAVTSKINILTPIVVGDESVTVNYENDDTTQYTILYQRNAGDSTLIRQLTTTKDDGTTVVGPQEVLLENVENLEFRYGIDEDADGAMDDLNSNGQIDENDWVSAADVGNRKVIAVRIFLRARPAEVNPDLQVVSPRTLVSAVTLRNQCLSR